MVLQILSENDCANDLEHCVIGDSNDPDHHDLYAFRFKKYEAVVNVKPLIIDLCDFDTKQLLEELQNVLHELKTSEFVDLPPWEDRYKRY